MAAHMGFFVLSYLLGYVSLWLWWCCRPFPQERPRREQRGRLLMLVGAGTLMTLLVVETFGCFLHPMECVGDCMGGCSYPPHAAITGFGLWR
jgi:hypothetical protein